jgi:hypothetical protein
MMPRGLKMEMRATLFVALFIIPLVCLLVMACILSTNIILKNSINTYERIFTYYLSEIDDDLHAISIYLANTFSNSQNITELQYRNNDTKKQLNMQNTYLQFKQDITYYPSIQFMFIYDDGDISIASTPYTNAPGNLSYSNMKPFLAEYIADGYDVEGKDANWRLWHVNDEQYLICIMEQNGIYIGALVNTDTLMRWSAPRELRQFQS